MTEQNTPLTDPAELEYLEKVKSRIQDELERNNQIADARYRDVMEMKQYISDSKADMDHAEKVSARQTADEMGAIGAHTVEGSRRLAKLLKSAYFGRINFHREGENAPTPVYIGIHSFFDPEEEAYLVHDWRAPISSMFYDFETGKAHYEAPSGTERGNIDLKRQYKIEDGELQFMIESSLNIHDDVLQKELSNTSSEKMKNIVATIQRDQNAIIRNDSSHTLIIQGAAGSGKTSIALHRIAFLLYRFKETIQSSDILIISPNQVFASYISNVLPELGEENIQETTMESLAANLLGHKFQFQTFYEQVSELLNSNKKKYRERIQFKASLKFLKKLDEYILDVKNNNFVPTDVEVGKYTLPAEFISEKHNRLGNIPYAERVNELLEAVMEEMERAHAYEIKGKERTSVRKQLKQMFRNTNIHALYKEFYSWLEEPGMFKFASRSVYEHSDLFPLIYFQMQLEGLAAYDSVKHLVVDEMQDYTPVQYIVLNQLFPCKRTILGDANQSVNPLSSSSAESINAIFPEGDCVYMNKSYRSTIEISTLAQKINYNENLEPIERHGEEPAFIQCDGESGELDQVRSLLSAFFNSEFKSLGVICKTQDQANAVYEHVKDLSHEIYLLNPESNSFNDGVTIATAYLAKGLEFDEVIIPFSSDKNYNTTIDRHMLYVACTRAMHKLALTHSNNLPEYLTCAQTPYSRSNVPGK